MAASDPYISPQQCVVATPTSDQVHRTGFVQIKVPPTNELHHLELVFHRLDLV